MKTSNNLMKDFFFAALIISALTGIVDAAAPTPNAANAPPAASKKPTFDHVGPQVGQQLPDLRLRTMKGEVQRLGDAWHSGPALIVTSSFTCPKSRTRWPELAAITKKHGDKLNVVVVYVIEAHPVGSICPYKGIEDVTPENQREGILRRQPKTLDERLELAQQFKRYLRIDVPIYVDLLDNRAWKAFGAAPNIAFLVGADGIVAARQGWFDGPALEKSIEKSLATKPNTDLQRGKHAPSREAMDAFYKKLEAAGFKEWELTASLRDRKVDALAKILKKVPDAVNIVIEPDQGHPYESTLLMDAAQEGNVAAAELLLKHGADIHARTENFESPLQAANFSKLEMIKLLLRHKADVNLPATGRTPVHEALIEAHRAAAKIMIRAGAKEDLYSDISLKKTDRVQKALAVDPSMASRPDGAGRMPLDYAAANDRLEIAKLLIDSGAPVVDDALSATPAPLHYAIRRGSLPMVKLLLEAGHSASTAEGRHGEDATSEPALHIAITKDRLDIIELLVAHKADLKMRDTYSKTALHHAAGLGNAKIVEMLIRAGADVNATTTRFSLPCGSGEEETPQLNTPLHFAAAEGNPKTIKALLAGGANINAANVKGETPLISAIQPPIYTAINVEMQLKNMETLLIAGAAVNARDKQGRTALDIAVEEQNIEKENVFQGKGRMREVIALLAKHGAKSPKKD